ncbi:hypothetical protein AC249_AIPGENE18118 [Exaiptasia diaphana]|nr:hypothetical protein AC249_AIPGENE18118 [Exaiptasia diaphana]
MGDKNTNSGKNLPSLPSESLADTLQNTEFIQMFTKSVLPSIVDEVKQSLVNLAKAPLQTRQVLLPDAPPVHKKETIAFPITRLCPRPDVACAYTPQLDKFLPDLIPKCKTDDKSLRKTQDLVLDVLSPIAMSYEMVQSARDNPAMLDTSDLLSLLTRALQHIGNANHHLSDKRRAQVLNKIGHTSLSNESWENRGKDLFGQEFEKRLKQRSETAKAISNATFSQRGKQYFPRDASSTKTWHRYGVNSQHNPYNRYNSQRGLSFRQSRPFLRGRGRATATSTQTTTPQV